MNYADPRRWWALAALALSVLVVGLDSTILSVALPTLATELDASTGELQWIANAYTLVMAAALVPAGLLGDRFGRKRLLLVALALFGVASGLCAVAPSAGALIAARALLGLGAAFLMPLSMSVLTVIFSPEERPRALGIWVMATAISLPIGPIAGGLLLDHLWWGSIFLINVPVVALGLLAVWRFLPESRSPQRPRVDVGGVAGSAIGLAALTYGLIEAGDRGWTDARSLAAIVAGLLVLAGFVGWQLRLRRRAGGSPLIDLDLFRSRAFTWGSLLATVMSFALFGILFVGPQYLQAVGGYDALGTGLRLLPMVAGLVVGARLADRLAARAGAKVVTVAGLASLAGGVLLGATTASGDGYGLAAAWLALSGVGMGLALPTLMNLAMGALPPDRSGVGSGLIQSLRQVGGAVGVAVLGSILNAGYRGRLDDAGLPEGVVAAARESAAAGVAAADRLGDGAPLLDAVRSSFVHGMDVTLLACGGVAALGVVLAICFLPGRPAPLAEGGPGAAPATPGDAPSARRAESEHDVVA